jgi:hypothetical protein
MPQVGAQGLLPAPSQVFLIIGRQVKHGLGQTASENRSGHGWEMWREPHGGVARCEVDVEYRETPEREQGGGDASWLPDECPYHAPDTSGVNHLLGQIAGCSKIPIAIHQ